MLKVNKVGDIIVHPIFGKHDIWDTWVIIKVERMMDDGIVTVVPCRQFNAGTDQCFYLQWEIQNQECRTSVIPYTEPVAQVNIIYAIKEK